LDGLSDVVITSPANKELVSYNGTNFVNGDKSTIGIYVQGTTPAGAITGDVWFF
jgi:hypothetical protein